jgi:hypothetical protein
MRTKLFISHATPTDNTFAAWLAAKLELHSYETWVDVNNLDPSVDFWKTIESTIREESAKFLFVATRESVSGKRDGINKELAVADRVRKGELENFIVPLRVDDVPFDDFPVELVRINGIDFNNDWANGLIKLLEYLEKQGVSKTNIATHRMMDAMSRWRTVSASETAYVVDTNDNYYSNLFPVQLPKYLYVYNDTNIATELKRRHKPFKQFDNCILTFVCPTCIKDYCSYEIENLALEVNSLIENTEPLNTFGVNIRRPSSICVNLINWEICDIFYSRGMRLYKPAEQTESKKRYFFKGGKKVKRHDKDKYGKSLSGTYKGKHWHYGQSAYFMATPLRGILFRSHLLFTDSNYDLLSDAQQISARRSKGKRFFNNDWRDLLQAAMFSNADGKSFVSMNLCCEDSKLSISREPYTFRATKGYIEPSADPSENSGGGYDEDDE